MAPRLAPFGRLPMPALALALPFVVRHAGATPRKFLAAGAEHMCYANMTNSFSLTAGSDAMTFFRRKCAFEGE